MSDGSDRVRPARLAREALFVGLTSIALVALHLRIWRANLSEPFSPGGDGLFYGMVVEGVHRHNTTFTNPDIGWPFGQVMHDAPQNLDTLPFLIMRIFSAIFGAPWPAINLFYLFTFGSVAALAYVAFRLSSIRRWIAVVLSLVYATAPYHFLRNEQHLLLSAYHFIPLAVVLALSLFGDDLPFVPKAAGATASGRWRPTFKGQWWTVALIVGVTVSGPYYLVFTLGLVTVAAVFAAVRSSSRRPLVSAAAIIAVACISVGVMMAPTVVHLARNGQNPEALQRSPFETETYGLRISQLFMPRLRHRIDLLSRAAESSQGYEVPSEPGQSLGVIAGVGLVIAVAAAGAAALGKSRGKLGRQLMPIGMLSLVCVLATTVSGFSLYLSGAGLRIIRSWNRMSIVLAFFGLLALAHVIQWWLAGRDRPGRAGFVLAVGLLGIAAVDQVSPKDIPPYEAIHATTEMENAVFRRMAADQGPGAAVLQWPHMPFLEHPSRGSMGAYDHATAYLAEPTLRYSYGFLSGRHPDYPMAWEGRPAEEWLADVVAIGFRAILVDRYALEGLNAVPDAEPSLTAVLGPPVIVSANNRYAYYDLRSYATATIARLGEAALAERAKTVLGR